MKYSKTLSEKRISEVENLLQYANENQAEKIKLYLQYGTKEASEKLGINIRTIPRIIKSLIKKMESKGELKIVDHVEEDDSPEIEYIGDQAVTLLLPDTGWKTYTEKEVNDYFLYYSIKGHNYTGLQMMNEFGFSPRDWAKFKNHFLLYKKSNIFAPFSFERIPVKERENAVAARLQTVFDNPNKVIDRAYTKSLQRNLKKTLDEVNREKAINKHFFQELASQFEQNPITKAVNLRSKSSNSIDELFTSVSDVHINSRVQGLMDTDDYNNDICREYLSEVARVANDKRAKSQTVLINGDIIESVTGKNHPDVFTEMEYKSQYAAGILKAVDLLVDFLSKFHNLDNVLIIAGNHDRLTSSNHEDAYGGAAELIAEFLKYNLKFANIRFHPKVLVHEFKRLCFICSHGDKIRNIKADSIFHRYGSRDKFNLYLTGHWHNREIKADFRYGRHISLPSIFPGNTYSDHGGYSTNPGFVLAHTDPKSQKLVVEDRSLIA